MNQKFLLAIGASFVVVFLWGWLYYGMLIKDYLQANTTFMNTEPAMWGIVVSSLCSGILYAYIASIAAINNPMRGLIVGGIVGALAAGGFDFMAYASGMFTTPMAMVADIVGVAMMGALATAAAGWVMGRGSMSMATS